MLPGNTLTELDEPSLLPSTPLPSTPDQTPAKTKAASPTGSVGKSGKPYALDLGKGTANRGVLADMNTNRFMKEKMRKVKMRTRARTRAVLREADVEALAGDMRLHPHLMKEEILSLGLLFDQYAEEDGLGDFSIDKNAVGEMVDEALTHLYENIDMDRSGQLDRAEVSMLLESLGQRMSNSELDKVMEDLDDSGDGSVDFQEFKVWWEKRTYHTKENKDAELADMFAAVDTDGSGEIDWPEFLEMIGAQLRRDEQVSQKDRDARGGAGEELQHRHKTTELEEVGRTPRNSAAMLRLAMETVQADMRAIYGTIGRSTGRVNMRGQKMTEITAVKRRCFFRPHGTGRSVQFRQGCVFQSIFKASLGLFLRSFFRLKMDFYEQVGYPSDLHAVLRGTSGAVPNWVSG